MPVTIVRMSPAEGRAYCERTPIWPRAQKVILHHTSSPNAKQYRGLSTVEAIQRYHVEARDFVSIGYHFLVGPDGACYNGRPMDTLGAHAGKGQNQHIGIAAIADFTHEDPWAWGGMETLRSCLNILLGRIGKGPEALHGHREYMQTDCPGDLLDIGALRRYLTQQPLGPPVIDPSHPKVVRWPGEPSDLIDCHAAVEGGVTRCDLRPVVEALGWQFVEPVEENLREQGKLYLKREAADG